MRSTRFGSATSTSPASSTTAELPGYAGLYTLAPAVPARILEYHAYTLAADAMAIADDYGARWELFVAEHEGAFVDLIESDTWSMVDAGGKRQSILVPLFHADGAISWRITAPMHAT